MIHYAQSTTMNLFRAAEMDDTYTRLQRGGGIEEFWKISHEVSGYHRGARSGITEQIVGIKYPPSFVPR